MNVLFMVVGAVILVFFSGVRIVRPTHRGLIERLGKYHRFAIASFGKRDKEIKLANFFRLR